MSDMKTPGHKSHQLSDVTQDKADTMSVQELDAAYSSTIEKWLASHTIPVRTSGFMCTHWKLVYAHV